MTRACTWSGCATCTCAPRRRAPAAAAAGGDRRRRRETGGVRPAGRRPGHDSAPGSMCSRGRAVAGAQVASRRKAQHGSSRTVFHEGNNLSPGDTDASTGVKNAAGRSYSPAGKSCAGAAGCPRAGQRRARAALPPLLRPVLSSPGGRPVPVFFCLSWRVAGAVCRPVLGRVPRSVPGRVRGRLARRVRGRMPGLVGIPPPGMVSSLPRLASSAVHAEEDQRDQREEDDHEHPCVGDGTGETAGHRRWRRRSASPCAR